MDQFRKVRISHLKDKIAEQSEKLQRLRDNEKEIKAELARQSEKLQHLGHNEQETRNFILHKARSLEDGQAFLSAVHDMKYGNIPILDWVKRLAQELDRYVTEGNCRAQDIHNLLQSYNDLLRDTIGTDNERSIGYLQKTVDMRIGGRNIIEDLTRKNKELKGEVDALCNGKREVAEELEFERSKYEAEHRNHEKFKSTSSSETRDLRTKLEDTEARYKDHISRMEKDHKITVADLEKETESNEAQHQARAREMGQDYRYEKQNLQQECKNNIQELTRSHQIDIQQMQEEHNLQSTLMHRKLAEQNEFHRVEWAKAASKMQKDQEAQIKNLRAEHGEDIAQMAREHEAECRRLATDLNKLNGEHALKVTKLECEFETECRRRDTHMTELKEEHASELTKLEGELDTERREMSAQVSSLKQEHASELAKQESAFDADRECVAQQAAMTKAQLEEDHRKELASIKKRHEAEKSQLLKDREAYSAALLARDKERDKFEELKDVEIKTKVLELSQGVNKLARLQWKNDKGLTRGLSRLSPTPKSLMRQVLQDTIWAVLHEHIFCSPFRAFGEEGRKLEVQWNEQCGKGLCVVDSDLLCNGQYTWPTPEVETERWRYVNVRECRAVLKKPVPSEFDPRAKLKKSFFEANEKVKDKLNSVLREVADIDEGTLQTIKQLTITATNIWLEFGMQRSYRIFMDIQDLGLESVRDRIAKAQEVSLNLVVVPALKSVTTSKNEDSQAEVTLIGGFSGEIMTVGGSRRS